MNIKVIIRGIYIRLWQRLPNIKYRYLGVPMEFMNPSDPKLPCYIGIDGIPVGASGFTLINCGNDRPYHASLLYYNTFGNAILRNL